MNFSYRYLLATLTLSLSALTLSAAAHAAPLSYTTVDAGVISTELNNSSLDGNGILLRGSLAVHPTTFLFAQVSDIGYDSGVDGFSWALGAGGHVPLTNQYDLVGKLGYVRQDIDYRGIDNTESGYLVSGSVRGFVVDKLEVESGVKHVHLADSGNDTSLTAEGRYFFAAHIAGGVFVQVGDTTAFGINARFTF